MIMYIKSELMIGETTPVEPGRVILHIRNKGMKSVLDSERINSRLADQMMNLGKEQR
jgi:hypothetical protein